MNVVCLYEQKLWSNYTAVSRISFQQRSGLTIQLQGRMVIEKIFFLLCCDANSIMCMSSQSFDLTIF